MVRIKYFGGEGGADSHHPWCSGLRPVSKADAQNYHPDNFVEPKGSHPISHEQIKKHPHGVLFYLIGGGPNLIRQ